MSFLSLLTHWVLFYTNVPNTFQECKLDFTGCISNSENKFKYYRRLEIDLISSFN